MTAYNVVRFKVKAGQETKFLDAHRHLARDFPGLRGGGLIKTGDRTYCLVGEWDSMANIAAARPAMIANLNSFRDTLEDLGGGLGVTDPVSGDVIMSLKG
jgi:antibiotic biosynthesis monooxygenase (ABM) superfamily enzyme